MELSSLTAISSLDGRYAKKTEQLRPIVSEYGLIFYRLIAEIHWLIALSENDQINEIPKLTENDKNNLRLIMNQFNQAEAEKIKAIEATINHDVKAVEYYLREKLSLDKNLKNLCAWIHFACTSEDINNLAYALMQKTLRDQIIEPAILNLISAIDTLAKKTAEFSMLSRTHGQPASPTTLGKELKNFAVRLKLQLKLLLTIPMMGKCNGAVGNFNAHVIAYPEVNWLLLSKNFVESLGLHYNEYTTQIEPHDFLAQFLNALSACHLIMIDFNRDIWGYISQDYFTQMKSEQEVGSSTMPHKINPIDFENAEGNLGLSIALANHLANKLPISRFQRDLSDSTVLRNLGSIFGYAIIAYQAMLSGLNKLKPNKTQLENTLNQHWEILTEAIQTVMRRYNITDAYEQLKILSRGEKIDSAKLNLFIDQLTIPDATKKRLKKLTPCNYTGLATELANKEI
ncbi:MAG: hypothetical protein ACD_29C00098G0006 [uncultured bacterium]|nr:MAG: hypothetical protein ACD_29C00098G0006 [uncultured bacterium]